MKFKLQPVIALTKDEAKLEEMNDQVYRILKSSNLDASTKMAYYEDFLARIQSFKEGMDRGNALTIVQQPIPVEKEEKKPRARRIRTPKTIKQEEVESTDDESTFEHDSDGIVTPLDRQPLTPKPYAPHKRPRLSPLSSYKSADSDLDGYEQEHEEEKEEVKRRKQPRQRKDWRTHNFDRSPVKTRSQVGNGRIHKVLWSIGRPCHINRL